MLNFIVLEVAYSPSPFNLATRVRSLPRRPCFFSEGGGGGARLSRNPPQTLKQMSKTPTINHAYE